MSFDALLSILFVLAFIVLPLLSRVLRQRSQPGQGAPGRPAGGTPPPARDGGAPPWLAEAQRRVREAREPGSAGGAVASTEPRGRSLVPEDPFSGGRLPPADGTLVPQDPFEAPPRAQDGRSLVPEDPFGRPTSGDEKGGLVPDDPFGGGLGGGPAGRGTPGPRPAATLGREGVPTPKAAPTLAVEVAEIVEIEAAASADRGASRVRRRGRHRGARLGPVGSIRFGRRAVVHGLIWHEILDEPASERRQRRRSSRPRSR